jgi:hypothetical protein
MNVLETDCDKPDRLTEQGERQARKNQQPIDHRVVEHDLRVKSQGDDHHDQWKKCVPIAKKEISNGDIPGMQLITVLFLRRESEETQRGAITLLQ